MKAKSSKRKTHKKRGAEYNPPILIEPSTGQLSYIDSLLEMSETTEKEYQEYLTIDIVSEGVAQELITELLTKQRNPILGGFNYQQGDIIKMLKLLK